jgi:hypothetical protein
MVAFKTYMVKTINPLIEKLLIPWKELVHGCELTSWLASGGARGLAGPWPPNISHQDVYIRKCEHLCHVDELT